MLTRTTIDPLRSLATGAYVRASNAVVAGPRREHRGRDAHPGGHRGSRTADDATDARRPRVSGTRGQATTEYALILLAAALVGLMVVAWATAGGGAARISRLFNGVIDSVIDKV
jgi:hypothetical protein